PAGPAALRAPPVARAVPAADGDAAGRGWRTHHRAGSTRATTAADAQVRSPAPRPTPAWSCGRRPALHYGDPQLPAWPSAGPAVLRAAGRRGRRAVPRRGTRGAAPVAGEQRTSPPARPGLARSVARLRHR